jgi:8-oxo-dGTP pyrophosphatase MutT (NUDIX family)
MQLVFSDDIFPTHVVRSIFLEGPSPRQNDVPHWRYEALEILETMRFDGTVFIPVPRARFLLGADDAASWTYDGQIEWECAARKRADVKVCWLARTIDRSQADLGMPGFTTNFELGEDFDTGNLVYGRPASAEKCRYMDKRVASLGLPVHESLEDLLNAAIESLGEGAERSGGEVHVPLFIWRSPQFQSWYGQLKAAGNRLESAELAHEVTFGGRFLFSYILWVNVWVEKEQRFKSNEFIFSRTDISTVIAYNRSPDSRAVRLALVREFRSPANNALGYVFEAPGGSSTKPGKDPLENAADELREELGLTIDDLSRFKTVGTRQVAATLSTHKAHVYAIELTGAEMDYLEAIEIRGLPRGVPRIRSGRLWW